MGSPLGAASLKRIGSTALICSGDLQYYRETSSFMFQAHCSWRSNHGNAYPLKLENVGGDTGSLYYSKLVFGRGKAFCHA